MKTYAMFVALLFVISAPVAVGAESLAIVRLPGDNNVFCNEMTIIAGDEDIFLSPCQEYDKLRVSTQDKIVALFDELVDSNSM